MKTVGLLVLVALAGVMVGAEEFYLEDPDSREKFGPFVYGDDATVVVEGTSYLIRTVDKSSALEKRLRDSIVASLEFRNANILDVVSVLRKKSERSRPRESAINIVFVLPPVPEDDDSTQMGGFKFPPRSPESQLPKITYSLRNVSIYDALDLACRKAGLEMLIREDFVELLPKAD